MVRGNVTFALTHTGTRCRYSERPIELETIISQKCRRSSAPYALCHPLVYGRHVYDGQDGTRAEHEAMIAERAPMQFINLDLDQYQSLPSPTSAP